MTHQPHGNLKLEIEELVLDGFSHLDPDAFSQALHRELQRLVDERGLRGGPNAAEITIPDATVEIASSPAPDVDTAATTVARQLYHTVHSPHSTNGHQP